jgi:glycosyltransferase involved in cell wall biosynthesis
MRIAQIAPLAEAVPPKRYGGTERVVSFLTEELVRQGHEVTLFASADSRTSAKLVSCCRTAVRLDESVNDHVPYTLLMLDRVRECADQFDILHFHIELQHFPLFQDIASRTVTTLHGRLDAKELSPFYARFSQFPLVSISQDQRRPLPPVSWAGTVYHGLPLDLLPFSPAAKGGYLAFLGRISPEKRPDRAIEIAKRSGVPLRIAAKIDDQHKEYFEEHIRPQLDNPLIEFVDEIGDSAKGEFLGQARALLFPIDWPEPFGLVMIEAMACGTPVIAYAEGSVPEIIDESTGFIVNNTDEAVQAVSRLDELDRAAIRGRFEERFSARRMAENYVEIYRKLAEGSRQPTNLTAEERPDGHSKQDSRFHNTRQTAFRHGGGAGASQPSTGPWPEGQGRGQRPT